MAKIVGTSDEELQLAAKLLGEGKLVAIPTETVYGLGGNALREDAALKIFAVKGRPLTDPLICHTDTLAKVATMWDPALDRAIVDLALAIGGRLWPGPLTIVCRAHPRFPNCVTGGSGCIGARIPRHPATLELLRRLDFPVAAPSANMFGHVSPTTAQHVYNDLAARDPDLVIIDGGPCEVGIESTVVKIAEAGHIEVLRRGRICVSDLQAAIADSYPTTRVEVRDTRSKYNTTSAAEHPMDAPGQLLTHYSPRIPASLLTPASMQGMTSPRSGRPVIVRGASEFDLSHTVVIDFGGLLRELCDECLSYSDLSARGDATEACHAVFDALRWCEQVQDAENVVFPFLSEWPMSANVELLAAVEDRLFRAASGSTALLRDVPKEARPA